MSIASLNDQENYDNMTVAQFEDRLPDLFASGDGKVSQDPRFATFLASNPDCAALVKDLETIADYAKNMFEPSDESHHEPSDQVWANIASKLNTDEELPN